MFDAQMSMPFSLAVAAFKGKIDEGDITEKSLDDPALQTLAAKVTVEADAAMTAAFPADWPADIRVETTDGRTLERAEDPWNKGHHDNPETPEQVRAKFRQNVAGALPDGRAEAIIDAVAGLDEMTDIGQLVELCVL